LDLATQAVDLAHGVRIPYVEQGDPSGIPLLLLHGLTDSWRSFELVLARMPSSIRTIALTQRGHGSASHPATGYRPSDFVADLVGFVDALGLEAAVLAGHSSHSFVVERFAVDHPKRTLGLVLIGAPLTLRGKAGVGELLELVSVMADPVDPDFVRTFVEGTIHRPVSRDFLEAMIEECLKVPAHVWREAFPALLDASLVDELAHIAAPVLLMWGDQDAIVSREEQDTLVGAIPNASLRVYHGTGHTPHWEEPERFAHDLQVFVESLRT
jgi:pimeloyl-ACP methyl ester carboxylesterase